jgi:hypothetical protein
VGAETPATNGHFLTAFRQGMHEHGYVDGQNLTIEPKRTWNDSPTRGGSHPTKEAML